MVEWVEMSLVYLGSNSKWENNEQSIALLSVSKQDFFFICQLNGCKTDISLFKIPMHHSKNRCQGGQSSDRV